MDSDECVYYSCEEGVEVTRYHGAFRGLPSLTGTTDVGITYCDYGQEILICKPKAEMYEKAMMEAEVTDKGKCYFVDDSLGISPFCHSRTHCR